MSETIKFANHILEIYGNEQYLIKNNPAKKEPDLFIIVFDDNSKVINIEVINSYVLNLCLQTTGIVDFWEKRIIK